MQEKHELKSGKINLPWTIGVFVYEITESERMMAWELFVQTKTNRVLMHYEEGYTAISLEFNFANEVLMVYDACLAGMPIQLLEKENGLGKIQLLVIEEGIKPFLAKWQDKFCKWEREPISNENKGKTVLEMQKLFPEYELLVQDLNMFKNNLNKYANELLKIAKKL